MNKSTLKLIIKVAEILAGITLAAIDIITGRKHNDSERSSEKK